MHPCLYWTTHMQHLLLFPMATGELLTCLVYKNDWMTFNPIYIKFNDTLILPTSTFKRELACPLTSP